jgi:hypothetical protein
MYLLTTVHACMWEVGSTAVFSLIPATKSGWSPWQMQLYCRGKGLRCLLNRGLGGPQNGSGCFGEKRNLLPLPGFEPRFINGPAIAYTCPECCGMHLILGVDGKTVVKRKSRPYTRNKGMWGEQRWKRLDRIKLQPLYPRERTQVPTE